MSEPSSNPPLSPASFAPDMESTSNGKPSPNISATADGLERNLAANAAEFDHRGRPKEDDPNEVGTGNLEGPAGEQVTQHSFAQEYKVPNHHVQPSKVHAEGEVPEYDGPVAEDTPPLPENQNSHHRNISWGDSTNLPWTGELYNRAGDPAAFLPGITRSMTFPEVPLRDYDTEASQLDQPQPSGAEVSHNQSELGVVHTSKRDAFDDEIIIQPSSQENGENDMYSYSRRSLEGPNAFSNLTESQPEFLDNPTDADSRYDEGLPLIQKADSLEEGSQPVDFPQQLGTESHSGGLRNASGVISERSAANLEQDQGLGFPFHPPERKSTEQVLNSLHITSSQEAQGGSEQGTSQQLFPDSAHSQGSEGIAESSWLPKMEKSKEEAPYHMDGSAPEDKDLAAIWQAVLGDDEFLDESDTHNDIAQAFPQGGGAYLGDQPWDLSFANTGQGLDIPTSSILQTSGMAAPRSPSTSDLLEGVPQATGRSTHDSWLSHSTQPSMASAPLANLQTANVPSNPTATYQAPHNVNSPLNSHSPSVSNTNYARQYSQPWPQQHQQRPEITKAQSFADKSKGGYSSPYDLPMDIAKSRKRGYAQHNTARVTTQGPQQAAVPPPPARSSSMFTSQTPRGASKPLPNPFTGRSASISSVSQQPLANPYQPAAPPVKPSPSSSSFFEDLPVTANPRRSSNSGKFPPQNTLFGAEQAAPLPPRATGQPYNQPYGAPAAVAQRQQTAPPPMAVTAEQLRAPERFGPFDSSPQSSTAPLPASTYGSRYSPVPPTQATAQSRTKYAPVPATAPPSNKLPHQPRTSSPLSQPPTTSSHQSKSSGGSSTPGTSSYLSQQQPRDGSRLQQAQYGTQGYPHKEPEPPMVRTGYSDQGAQEQNRLPVHTTTAPSSPPKQPMNNYTRQDQLHSPSGQRSISPPRRSQTQSPGAAQASPIRSSAVREPYQRPASVNVPTAPGSLSSSYPSIPSNIRPARPRGVSHALNYITPNDGRENDPLCRWRGCPIISWGFGGTVVTTFPKHVQRYSTGQPYPSIKCSPGEVKTRYFNNLVPLEEHVARFSGPLRGKGKKKEAISWLSLRIDQLAKEEGLYEYTAASGIPRKREERLLLLKTLRIFIENDGSLAGNGAVQKAVSDVFSSYLEQSDGEVQSLSTSSNQAGGSSSDSADPEAINHIRKTLLSGDRESAIWQAVDKRLWGHALIISSTVNGDIWKQVVQEFVRKELRQLGGGAKSLSALYEIFGGNWEESIDELVPASARAGFQLINKNTDSASTKNALEGLEKWAETLMLVLSNRTTDDGQALAALGRLLLGYGRVEAAHICYMLARPFSSFSGSDDPQTSIALVGANHLQMPFNLATEVESILLSEIYEFGLSLVSSTLSSSVPHLQSYKLYHALLLAEHGYRSEAQQYCDGILSTIRSSTKPSGYHHGLLLAYLDDFSRRLQQSPKDGSSSWISKPSMEKVSGTLFAKFNSFIAGDENDNTPAQGDTDIGGNDVGPFARIAGNTPSISRPSSQNDSRPVFRSHNTVAAGAFGGVSGAVNRYSPYVPAGPYVPQTPEQEPQETGSQSLPYNLNRAVTEPIQTVVNNYIPSEHQGRPEVNSMQSPYYPNAPSEGTYGNWGIQEEQNEQSSNMPNGDAGSKSANYGYPSYQTEDNSQGKGFYQSNGSITQTSDSQQPDMSNYQPSSYEPPISYGTYEPPSADTHHADTENDTVSADTGRKVKSTLDDDDDDDVMTRAAELAKKERAQKDKEAEENFRKAAEADGESYA